MRRRLKKIFNIKENVTQQITEKVWISNPFEMNWNDRDISYVVEWCEDSTHECDEPNSYTIYVLRESKAKEILFDLLFGLRNSESWSKHVPHCKNRKVTSITIEVSERDDGYSTNSLYCNFLGLKAIDYSSK